MFVSLGERCLRRQEVIFTLENEVSILKVLQAVRLRCPA
jgi:hypothetical protein